MNIPAGQQPAPLIRADSLGEVVAAMTALFREAGVDTPALDARRLAAWALGLDAVALLREPERSLAESELCRLSQAAARRLAREPVSRIVGERAFRGLDLQIGPPTLDPRADTETLVAGVLRLVSSGAVRGTHAPRILDLGTGSGAILLALLCALPSANGVGVDISPEALAFAAFNANRHRLERRARFQRSNWLEGIGGRFDIVVSNPPYIPRHSIADLEPEVGRFDPAIALDGGLDGLDAYRAIAAGVASVVEPGGWIAVEVGAGQSGDAADILAAAFSDGGPVEQQVWLDLSGTPRCVALRAPT